MIRSLIYSITFHSLMIILTVLSLPFMLREPVDLPPIVSVELIQISDKTNIPFAPKARKIIEETKKRKTKELFLSKLLLQQKQKKNLIEFLCQMKKRKKRNSQKKTESRGNQTANKTIFRI